MHANKNETSLLPSSFFSQILLLISQFGLHLPSREALKRSFVQRCLPQLCSFPGESFYLFWNGPVVMRVHKNDGYLEVEAEFVFENGSQLPGVFSLRHPSVLAILEVKKLLC